MKPIRVLSIFGTRPEAVKMAPVVRQLAQVPGIDAQVCVTAQHRQMLDQVLNLFGIRPHIDLDIMRPDQSLSDLTARILSAVDQVLADIRPDWVLVQGDTTTVMAAAMAAFYRQVKVGHVEAGLRTYDMRQPFPEEANRRIAGVLADLHFAPTQWAADNLLREGTPAERVHVTGNPVIDALQWVAAQPPDETTRALLQRFGLDDPSRRLVLITAHRRENFGAPLEQACEAIAALARHYGDSVQWVYPVHLNPNVQRTAYARLSGLSNVHLLDPLDYAPLIHLMRRASLVLTDSGGLQEEAPGLGVPVLVLRQVTERPEGVQAGVVRLVGTHQETIIETARQLLDDPSAHAAMAQAVNPYGDGHAAERIVRAILENQA